MTQVAILYANGGTKAENYKAYSEIRHVLENNYDVNVCFIYKDLQEATNSSYLSDLNTNGFCEENTNNCKHEDPRDVIPVTSGAFLISSLSHVDNDLDDISHVEIKKDMSFIEYAAEELDVEKQNILYIMNTEDIGKKEELENAGITVCMADEVFGFAKGFCNTRGAVRPMAA